MQDTPYRAYEVRAYEGKWAAYAWGSCLGLFDTEREARAAAWAAYTAPEPTLPNGEYI